ncbi:hypothetical protein GOP47_0003037 [Adiantum capillus-veneris]|uniref:Uncharacterized protein n=1 Tax=Adiantum capillus-veneris TaxID=13818 RepID=A0A9D4VBG4_ADICA|nr:hypothetical protein GOP47_0003037 [Adiantum capillus-veneris]
MPISARKLAASFWEQYGAHKLDQADDQHITEACQDLLPISPAPLNTQLQPSTLVNCQITGALKVARGVAGGEEVSNRNMASNQAATLVNVLHRVRSVEETQSRSMVMINKLRLDAENTAIRIHELEFSHKATLREMNNLLQRFGEQMAISRRNEQEKVRLTFLQLREEMEEERDTCRLLQMQNKKLSEDLTHASMAAADACEELNRERKARELLEEVCNELAREIGEDKAEVEQLKQEQEESREKLEQELKLMRMAALWREEKVRNKLEEAKLELEYNGKQGMPLHEIRGKPEVSDTIVVVGESSTFQEEINNQAGQDKLFTQALEKMEHEKAGDIEHNMDNVSSTAHLASVPAWLDAHFSMDRAPKSDNQICEDRGTHSRMETNTLNGLICTRKQRKLRRRLRTSGQQGQMTGVGEPQARAYDVKNPVFWEAYCGNFACPSSDNESDRRHSIALHNCTPRMRGLISKSDSNNTPNLHDTANLVVEDGIDIAQATEAKKPSVFSSSSKHTVAEVGPSLGHCRLNDASSVRSPKKHSSSARFEAGKLSCKSEADTGPKIQHSFSEDDASSYIASRTERGRKKDGLLSPCLPIRGQKNQAGHRAAGNDKGTILKATGGGGVGSGEDSELDDFYFEPVRRPTDAYHNKPNYRAIGGDDGANKARQERGFVKCGDDACCGVMAKCSQACKELKADEKPGCITVIASPEAEGNMVSGGQETLNKMSPWRSATGKPLQCLWPPSPDVCSVFGGSKRRGRAGTSTSANIDAEGGLHSHARRHLSPAKQAVHQLPVGGQKPELQCMRSNSLGAQLIEARACDSEKPLKTSFRFSPLRRATSHG